MLKRFGEPVYPARRPLGQITRGEASQPYHAVIDGPEKAAIARAQATDNDDRQVRRETRYSWAKHAGRGASEVDVAHLIRVETFPPAFISQVWPRSRTDRLRGEGFL